MCFSVHRLGQNTVVNSSSLEISETNVPPTDELIGVTGVVCLCVSLYQSYSGLTGHWRGRQLIIAPQSGYSM